MGLLSGGGGGSDGTGIPQRITLAMGLLSGGGGGSDGTGIPHRILLAIGLLSGGGGGSGLPCMWLTGCLGSVPPLTLQKLQIYCLKGQSHKKSSPFKLFFGVYLRL